MKIVSKEKSLELIANCVKSHANIYHLPIYLVWKKMEPVILIFVSLLSSILAIVFYNVYRYDILLFLEVDRLNIIWRLIIGVLSATIIIVMMVAMIIIHELIHILCCKKYKCRSAIVFDMPVTISVVSLDWKTKTQELCTIIAPFIMFFIIAALLYYISENIFIFLWVMLMNLAISCSDILSFVIILMKVPADSLILSSYYRRQQ